MKKWRVWLLVNFIVVWAVPVMAATGTFTITLSDQIMLAGPRLTFADLGKVSGALPEDLTVLQSIDLGTVPLPGQVRTLGRDYLEFILRQHNFRGAWSLQMGKQIEVRSLSTAISGKEIEKAITAIVPPGGDQILKKWVAFANLPETVWLPSGQWQISVTPIGIMPKVGPALFRVVFKNGNDSRIMNINGRIRAQAVVYRALRPLPTKKELKPEDFETVTMELATGHEWVGAFPQQSRLVSPVAQGQVLRNERVQTLPLVEKDKEVQVRVVGENFEVQVTGVAMADGWAGNEIQVLNPASRKLFRGRVTAARQVEVKL